MSSGTTDELSRILEEHRERVTATRAAAEQKARSYADARQDCGTALRGIALPLLREWSKRLSVEGYPTRIEDRIGCQPPSLVLVLAPHGGPESFLTLACQIDRTVRFKMTVAGRDVGGGLEAPLASLEAPVVLEALGRFVTRALEATLVQP